MGNVTQCPRCATQFRVVPDQLKISDGWVRCGQCTEVFDARAAMVPSSSPFLAGGVPPPAPTTPVVQEALPSPGDSPEGQPHLDGGVSPDSAATAPSPGSVPGGDGWRDASEAEAVDVEKSTEVPHSSMHGRFNGDGVAADVPAALPLSGTVDTAVTGALGKAEPDQRPIVPDEGPPIVSGEAVALPTVDPSTNTPELDVSFVRQARRQAFWARRWVRALLGLVGAVLLLLLAGQVAVYHRDRLVAQYPTLQPMLQGVCEPLGCRLGAWRNIDAVVIEGSALVLMPSGNYRFEVNLRNTSALPVAMPALELSLTNVRDEVVLRRVLAPDEWSVATTVLAARADHALAVELSITQAGEIGMSGYRVVVFYP